MPLDWKLLALFIALSGLFSVALSTAVMLSMSPLFRYAWMKKHAHAIEKRLKKWDLKFPELDDEPPPEFTHFNKSAITKPNNKANSP